MSYSYISVARENAITIITIERPEARNALNANAQRELSHAFDEFSEDADQWIAIITGSGDKAFCAGHDLKQQALGGGIVLPETGFGGLTARWDLDKPVIAAVNGVALGGGFEIVLACDIVVASERAQFALPEPRVGLAALAGGMHRLPREIGMKRAMGMMLTGSHVSAADGLALGFVNEVVDGDPLDAARNWAARMAECSPMSLRATKRAALAGFSLSYRDAFESQEDLAAVQAMFASEDGAEGPMAFIEKRRPNWKGR